jgi:hypothetical protein
MRWQAWEKHQLPRLAREEVLIWTISAGPIRPPCRKLRAASRLSA